MARSDFIRFAYAPPGGGAQESHEAGTIGGDDGMHMQFTYPEGSLELPQLTQFAYTGGEAIGAMQNPLYDLAIGFKGQIPVEQQSGIRPALFFRGIFSYDYNYYEYLPWLESGIAVRFLADTKQVRINSGYQQPLIGGGIDAWTLVGDLDLGDTTLFANEEGIANARVSLWNDPENYGYIVIIVWDVSNPSAPVAVAGATWYDSSMYYEYGTFGFGVHRDMGTAGASTMKIDDLKVYDLAQMSILRETYETTVADSNLIQTYGAVYHY